METLVLKTDSPYADGSLITLPNKNIILNRKPISYIPNINDERHTVIQGETLTGIAYRKYRTKTEHPAKYWWIIADANGILNPLDLTDLIGYEIVIPDFYKTIMQ